MSEEQDQIQPQTDPPTTQLIEAAQSGDLEALETIKSETPDLDINFKDPAGSTALLYACNFGHESAVKWLLENNADPNIQDKVEWTPLMWAVNNNYLGIVKLLLEYKADPEIKTSSGRSVFDLPISETSATYVYLSGLNLIKQPDFYKPTAVYEEPDLDIPLKYSEPSDPINTGLEMNNTDLGLDMDSMDTPIPAVENLVIHPDFNWDSFKVKDSLALPRDRIPEFLDMVITNYKPTLDKHQLPVSANALFLAFRYQLYCGTSDGFTTLTTPIVRRIMLVCEEEEHANDLAFLNYWLANSEALLYYTKRDPKMAQETQENFMASLKNLVASLSGQIEQLVISMISPLIPPCVLHFDSIPEYGDVQYRDQWKLFKPKVKDDRQEQAQKHLLPPSQDVLVKNPGPTRITSILSSQLLLFQIYGTHSITQTQILFKVLYFITRTVFNEIIDHKRFCTRRRAMQIRLNISVLEDWCRNMNFRPESTDINGQVYRFKSLIDVGRSALAPIFEILAWLQTFSAFGTDFTNVISTLQELKSLNPKQLLHTACNYRFETKESPLSKDYKHYLQELAVSHDRRKITEQLEEQEQKIAQDGSAPAAAANPGGGVATPYTSVQVSPTEIKELKESFVNISYEIPVAEEISLPELQLTERTPTLPECTQFWGVRQLNSIVSHQGARYLIPQISEDFSAQLGHIQEDIIPHQEVEPIQSAIKPEDGFDSFMADDIGPVW